jgi:hypothetical protein
LRDRKLSELAPMSEWNFFISLFCVRRIREAVINYNFMANDTVHDSMKALVVVAVHISVTSSLFKELKDNTRRCLFRPPTDSNHQS